MRSDSHGYTLVEIMTAVVVMTIGATGILAMQGASVRGNQDANETSNAVNFATTWMERVKRDARLWTESGATTLAQTKWLKAGFNTWFVPASEANESAAADFFGFDTMTDPRFCVNLRLVPVTGSVANPSSLRVDLRVWWHRASNDVDRTSATCGQGADNKPVDDATTNALKEARIRRQYLSTVVSYRPVGWP